MSNNTAVKNAFRWTACDGWLICDPTHLEQLNQFQSHAEGIEAAAQTLFKGDMPAAYKADIAAITAGILAIPGKLPTHCVGGENKLLPIIAVEKLIEASKACDNVVNRIQGEAAFKNFPTTWAPFLNKSQEVAQFPQDLQRTLNHMSDNRTHIKTALQGLQSGPAF